jgi:hypothetical protein
MPAPEGQSREDLYASWLIWGTTNLGGNPKLVEAAANAAADTAFRGDGFNSAVNAARAAWYAAAQTDQSLWRPSFWSLVLTSPFVWGVPLLLALIAVSAFSRVPNVALLGLMLLPVDLIIIVWLVGRDAVLSLGGAVAHGSLVNVTKMYPSRGGIPDYWAKYEFAYQGRPCTASHTYLVEGSIRQDVVVLFFPRFPRLAIILPEVLNPDSS